MLFISSVVCVAIKLVEQDAYIKVDGIFLRATQDVKNATNFNLKQVKKGTDFLVTKAFSEMVMHDPMTEFEGKIILKNKGNTKNQLWRFVFNDFGSLTIKNGNRRLSYDVKKDAFFMKDDNLPMVEEKGFNIVDVDMTYFDYFDMIPVINLLGVGTADFQSKEIL